MLNRRSGTRAARCLYFLALLLFVLRLAELYYLVALLKLYSMSENNNSNSNNQQGNQNGNQSGNQSGQQGNTHSGGFGAQPDQTRNGDRANSNVFTDRKSIDQRSDKKSN
jgi:hypothetical protein